MAIDSPQEPPEIKQQQQQKKTEPWWYLNFGLLGALVKKPAKPTVFMTHRTVRQCICVV